MTVQTVLQATSIRRPAMFLERRGVDPSPLLIKAGLTPSVLDEVDRMIPLATVLDVYTLAADAMGDPAFGLHLAEEASAREYGLLGYLFEAHPTLRASYSALSHFYGTFLADASLEILERGERVTLVSRLPADLPGSEFLRQEVLAAVFLKGAEATGADFHPIEVRLAMPEVAPEEFARVFGVRVQFDAEEDAMVFASEDLDHTMPTADPVLREHLLEAAEAHAKRRRVAGGNVNKLLRLQGCIVDLQSGVVHKRGRTINLTTKERSILEYFADRPNRTVRHDELDRDIWGLSRDVLSHAPAVAVRRLRQKIEPTGRKPVNLVTVFGEGWKLVVPGAEEA